MVVCIILFDYINKLNEKKQIESKILKYDFKWFGIGMAFILILWLPYFLRYFPGLTTNDSNNQIYQCLGYRVFSDHHPIVHTLLISIFVNLGKAVNSLEFGVALYTIFQMIVMSAIFSYTVCYMAKKKFPLVVRILSLLFFALYPINALFSQIMWKDIIFGGMVLLFTIQTYEFITRKDEKNCLFLIGYTLTLIGTILFRQNGIYVVILMFIIMLITYKKKWKQVLLTFGIALVFCFGLKQIIFKALNVEKGEIREALSIPMQQIAKVVKYHEAELSQDEINEIHKFIKSDNIGELYEATISDNIKDVFDSEAFSNNKGEFISLWLKLLFKHPKTYLEAFFSNNYGYYYTDVKSWVANRTMEKSDIIDLESNPLIGGRIVEKVDSIIENNSIPLISLVCSVGLTFWLIATSCMYIIYKKKYKLIIVYLPALILWLTTLASPVFCELRYVYGMFTSLPFLLALCFEKNVVVQKPEENKIVKNNKKIDKNSQKKKVASEN